MDVATRVGLQLLLEPSSSAHIFRGLCLGVGTAYPAYQSFKAVHSGAHEDTRDDARTRWLKYWAVLGTLSLAERPLPLDRLPLYPHAKLALLVWLQLRNNEGACLLFDRYLAPLLCRYELKVDACLQQGQLVMEALYHMYRVPIQALAAAAKQVVHFVAWFLEPPQGEEGDGRNREGSIGANGNSTVQQRSQRRR